jgi:hypothetical protein
MTNTENVLRLVLGLMQVGGTIILILAAFLIVGPSFESNYLPVVKDVKVYEVPSVNPDRVALSIIGDKTRACRFIEVTALSGSKDLPDRADIFVVTRTGATRPTGRQSFGVWEFEPSGDYVKVQVIHDCHPLWKTVTTFFEWRRE